MVMKLDMLILVILLKWVFKDLIGVLSINYALLFYH